MVHNSIQNLIFDLGGVILDLHFDRTYEAFSRAGRRPVSEIRQLMDASPFFNEYEKGLLTDDEFRHQLRTALNSDLPDEDIDGAWNAMLGAIPIERLRFLQGLRGRYRIFLLSNTNNIHLQFFSKIIQTVSGEPGLQSFFEHAHYSHVLKMRKPDREIFDHVLRQHQLDPAVTLFFDDNLANLKGAAEAGIQTFHVEHPASMMALFS